MIKRNFTRYFATVILGCLFCAQAYAQHTTDFLFVETVSENLRITMQNNAKAVFAEINRAYDQNKPELALSPSNVTDEASKRIHTMWATSHFYSTKAGTITTRVLKSSNGYQVRNIPIFIKEGETKEDNFQDCVIEFTIDGKISDINIAIAPHQIEKIMGNTNEMKDIRNRQMILELIENYRTAYFRKDIPYIEKFFDNDMIRGKGLKSQVTIENTAITQIDNTVIKKQYLAALQLIFNSNSYVNIKFDTIMVTRHPDNQSIYGFTLKQDWNTSSGYHDEGYLFQMIDFTDESNPLVWITTWQPSTDPNTGKEIHYNPENIFGLGSFLIK